MCRRSQQRSRQDGDDDGPAAGRRGAGGAAGCSRGGQGGAVGLRADRCGRPRRHRPPYAERALQGAAVVVLPANSTTNGVPRPGYGPPGVPELVETASPWPVVVVDAQTALPPMETASLALAFGKTVTTDAYITDADLVRPRGPESGRHTHCDANRARILRYHRLSRRASWRTRPLSCAAAP